MYNPESFRNDNQKINYEFIDSVGFATLISASGMLIQTSYLPFILDHSGQKLIGHMAHANPQWKNIENSTVLVSFKGPDRYISPSIYVNEINVPTWNYAVLEVHGQAKVIQDIDQIDSILKESVSAFEERNQTSWKYEIPEEVKKSLVKAIVGIEIKIGEVKAKFKLSQNRDTADFKAVESFLAKSQKDADREMLFWMRKLAQSNS